MQSEVRSFDQELQKRIKSQDKSSPESESIKMEPDPFEGRILSYSWKERVKTRQQNWLGALRHDRGIEPSQTWV